MTGKRVEPRYQDMPYAACEYTSAIPRRGGRHSSGASTSGSDGSKSADGGGSISGSDGSKSAGGGRSTSGCAASKSAGGARQSPVQTAQSRQRASSISISAAEVRRAGRCCAVVPSQGVPGSLVTSAAATRTTRTPRTLQGLSIFLIRTCHEFSVLDAAKQRHWRDPYSIHASPLAHFSQAKAPR